MEQKEKNKEQKEIIFFSCKDTKMRIAICDHDITFLKKLKSILYSYCENRRLDVVVDCYCRGEDMLASGVRYNVAFLNYTLCGENGLEIAKILRKENNYTAIIFISSDANFVYEAFKVSPYRFLLMPVDKAKLFGVMNEFFEEYGKNYPLWIKSRDDTFCLSTGDIYYLEADNKHCFIHLENEQISCNRTMARVFDVLPKYCFLKINRAFIINLNFVVRYNSDLVYLKNGEQLHISRNYFKSFKEGYLNFLNPRLP